MNGIRYFDNMNKVISSLIIALIPVLSFAQQTEPALARVHYEFFHVHDTLQPDQPTLEEMVLYVGQGSTLYGSYEFNRIMQGLEKQMADPAFDGSLTITSSRGNSPSSYYTHFADAAFQQIYRTQGAHYLLDENFPAIEWEIGQETKQIGGYAAQQAIGNFGGREYLVWFTTELPFHGGPWKLQGLPGLLLEAESLDGEVRFSYAGLETTLEGEQLIGIPSNVIATNPQALERLLEAIKRNPQAAMNARGAANQAPVAGGVGVITFSLGGNPLSNPLLDPSRIKSISVNRQSSSRSAVTNNPLEKIKSN